MSSAISFQFSDADSASYSTQWGMHGFRDVMIFGERGGGADSCSCSELS